MKQSVTGSSGGTRMNVFPGLNALVQAGTTFYVSWWDYYPATITFPSADFFQIWQIASYGFAPGSSVADYAPMWVLSFHQSTFTMDLHWSPNNAAPSNGPHNGETGHRIYTSAVSIPVGQWMFWEVMVTPSAGFTGALKVWMNKQVLFDLSSIKTRYPDGSGSPAPGLMYTTHNAYGSNLSPSPAVHYVDDVTYSLGRMP
jgi:hypothetical protein